MPQDSARSQQVYKRMFPEAKMGAALDTSQAVKQANMSAEAENRQKKVAKLGAKSGGAKGGSKAAKPAPSKAGGVGKSKAMGKAGKGKPAGGKPRRK